VAAVAEHLAGRPDVSVAGLGLADVAGEAGPPTALAGGGERPAGNGHLAAGHGSPAGKGRLAAGHGSPADGKRLAAGNGSLADGERLAAGDGSPAKRGGDG
jgi:hypothetical protein